jgi:hypothetical protein
LKKEGVRIGGAASSARLLGLKCYPNFGWGKADLWWGGEGFAGPPHKKARYPPEYCNNKLHGSRSSGFT